MNGRTHPLHVSLVVIPDAVISTFSGIYDVMNSFAMLAEADTALPSDPPFTVEIVGETAESVMLASGLPVTPARAAADIAATDIVIVPSVLVGDAGWEKGRYPETVAWLGRASAQGAVLCSACSGVFLIAETGLLDGMPSTVHWGYARKFAAAYPAVPLHPEKVLVAAGGRAQFVSSGASTSWHDLVLYLISQHVGPTAAQWAARFFALQWHPDGLAPYIVFAPVMDHGDAEIADAQRWLTTHYPVGSPVEEMIRRSGLAERTFKRRFTAATGLSPIAYIQRLRIEEAKRRLERTAAPADEVGWQVGYEDPAFFRRLFKRITGIPPGAYRRRFRIPDYRGNRTEAGG